MPSISIIIPVYNVEGYLVKCLTSILSQSFNDYEILLIDDGSTDESAKICDEFADRDDRIRVFHQPNQGVSVARNIGLDNAKGEWITFVDGDDSLFPKALDQVSELLGFDDDILVLNSIIERSGDDSIASCPYDEQFIGNHYSPKDIFKQFGYTRGSVCGCLFKSSIINSRCVRFSTSMKNSEDTFFFRVVLHFASKIYFADINFYNVYERAGSASRSWSAERILGFADSLCTVELETAKYGIEYRKVPLFNYFTYSLISSLYNHYSLIPNNKSLSRQIRKKIVSSLLYPIDMNGIPVLRNKIRVLNFSIDLFHFLIRIKQ